MSKKTTMLMIIDGYGINENEKGNAVKAANTPNLEKLFKTCPTTEIYTSGMKVGLPDGQMGNSEVGHTNIGAGRIVYQQLTRITKSIEDGDFFSIPEFVSAIENCKANNSKLHILGLLSDGGVHSHNRHLYGLLEMAKRKGFEDVYVHCFLDGRDTPPASAENYIIELEEKIKEKGVGKIASVSGRYYSMDRDKRWDRIQKTYNAIVRGEGEKAQSATKAIEDSYLKEVFDEFVVPTVICNGNVPVATISKNDSVIFFNFRPDRAREITRTLVDPEFNEFETIKDLNLNFVCMAEYDATLPNVSVAFKPERLNNTFGEYISNKGLTQLRIAETEKYAHVTFFFNGGEEKQYPGEDRILVPSPKVATYDLQPEMSEPEVTEKVVEAINSGKYDSIILNYANSDMVGHTGSMEAAIKALEAVDDGVGKVVEAMKNNGGVLLITADHGNSEQMIDYTTGEPHTAHTTNPVPLILVGMENTKVKSGKLADLAPTMLDIMGLEKPAEMTGESLLIRE
ncbi:MAG: 2,3-bisphosphoglycerate-independent phosphoglycerate mutase [Clostridia bacterium]|nr:2,3-bisphosphoglycerate-independent phosphoglycerate mutase [Clostridia bacterium]